MISRLLVLCIAHNAGRASKADVETTKRNG